MSLKTQIHAEEGQQTLTITREFDLPVELLYTAHTDPQIFEAWMSHEYGTVKVLKFDVHDDGGWHFQNADAQGNVVFQARGVFHHIVPNQKITRTFEMINTPFDTQLEFLEFEQLSEDTSRLTMQIVYRSGALRDPMLKLPFQQGLNMAHVQPARGFQWYWVLMKKSNLSLTWAILPISLSSWVPGNYWVRSQYWYQNFHC
jgi:uncharacterized protein YndB with AHSA1/START domain